MVDQRIKLQEGSIPLSNMFKSKAQSRWMWANDPEMAKEFASKTKSIKKLPEKVKKKKKK